MERHIFRGYLVSTEDVSRDTVSMTEDVICKIHEESNSQDEFCQKMGEIFSDRNGGHNPISLVSVVSQLKA